MKLTNPTVFTIKTPPFTVLACGYPVPRYNHLGDPAWQPSLI